MKVSEMNAHQKALYRIMDELTREFIGGCENSMMDYEKDAEEYKEAERFLKMGHKEMADFFYMMVMSECKAGSNAEHARFAGGDFLKERIEVHLNKWGY